MGIASYSVGKRWEDRVMRYYRKGGYATFKLATDIAGTVFDIIAIKNNRVVCIEAKHTKTKRLYYKGSGLHGKRDDLDHFERCGNFVILYVCSDIDGTYVITWLRAKQIFEERGYIISDDGVKIDV